MDSGSWECSGFFPSALFYVFNCFEKDAGEGHEWEERKEGERGRASSPPAGMTHPGLQPVAPCGSWVLIGDSLSSHGSLGGSVCSSPWVMRIATPGVAGPVCRGKVGGLGQEPEAQLPLRLFSGPGRSHPFLPTQ